MSLSLEAAKCALIVVDLQKGIITLDTKPHSTRQVIDNSLAMVAAMRKAQGTIVPVHVDLAHMLRLPCDKPLRDPDAPPPPPEASQLIPDLSPQPQDIEIIKNQWGAFFGTNLEAKLKEKNIETVIVCGIATNFGVESTARAAAGLGFATIVVEDACSSIDQAAHEFAFNVIFPKMGRVRKTAQILACLG